MAFLHNSVKMVHGNLCPESVIINNGGAWKMAGFDFCVSNIGSQTDVSFLEQAIMAVILNHCAVALLSAAKF